VKSAIKKKPSLAKCAAEVAVVSILIRETIMNNQELIPVFAGEIAGVPTQLIDARTLHAFLESKQQFSNWIQNRIEEYGFTQDVDFIVINNSIKNPNGGRPTIKITAPSTQTAIEKSTAVFLCLLFKKNRHFNRFKLCIIALKKSIKGLSCLKKTRLLMPLPPTHGYS
jgi:hypothetical protein